MSARRIAHAHNPLNLLEISLLTVVVAVAVAVAVPEYLHLRQDTSDDSAKSRLVDATRALMSRHDASGTYVGTSLPAGVSLKKVTQGSFCVETSVDGRLWHAAGPKGKPRSGSC